MTRPESPDCHGDQERANRHAHTNERKINHANNRRKAINKPNAL